MATHSFPRLYTRPDFDRLIAACEGVDGSHLVETFFSVKHATGKKTWDVTQTPEFRDAFVEMLHQVRAKARGGAA